MRMRRALSACRIFSLLIIVAIALPEPSLAAVGRTTGAGSVSSTGAANYSIPISLPPGTNNLAPRLSLVYDHRNGDSLIGMGFAISGLSTITRCSKSLAQDSTMGEPTLIVSDGYCLDGNRLRLTSGTYGTAGSTYQTEIETFARATAVSAAGGGPASWIVHQREGLIYEYGATSDSFIETVGSSTARVWALNRIRDRSGNYIDFSYTEDNANGAYRPNEIRYSGHTSGTAPATKVVFVYESINRPDPRYAYRYGSSVVDGKIHEFKRLDRLDVIYAATSAVTRTIDLTYESAGGTGGRSRLASVQECAAGDCLAATNFQWLNGSSGWNAEATTSTPIANGLLVLDINGDGHDDVAYSSSTTSGSGTWQYMLGTDSGFSAATNSGIANWNFADARVIDWDDDAFQDILVPCNGATTWCVLQSNGSGFSGPLNTSAALNGAANLTLSADINGDGREDLVRIVTGSLPHKFSLRLRNGVGFDAETTGWTAESNELRLTSNFAGEIINRNKSHLQRKDYNGDGREDFALRIEERSGEPGVPSLFYQFIFYGRGSAIESGGSYSTANQAGVPGDFNGDGLTDLVHLVTGGCGIKFGRGNGLSTTVAGPACVGMPAVTDYDGDGLSDLLMNNGTSWMVSRSTGNGFSAFSSTGTSAVANESVIVADVNGDGLNDLVRSDFNSANHLKYRIHSGVFPDLLDRVTDGFGIFVDFNYQVISSNTACYSVDNNIPPLPAPAIPYRGAMYVVCSHSASDGIGGSYSVSHSYFNAGMDYTGRGFLGFARKHTQDSRDNILHVQNFRRDFPYIGMVSSSSSRQPSAGPLIQETTNTYQTHTGNYNGALRYYPYLSNSVVKAYSVGSAINGALLSTATTSNTVSASNGAVTLSTTTIVEGSGIDGILANEGTSHTASTSQPALFNDFTNWCIGRPAETRQTRSHQLPGGAEIERVSTITWDGAMCRPTQSVAEPGSTLWQVTTIYDYDDFGNVDGITLQPATGQGQASRTSTMYWGTTGRFPESVTNAKLQTTGFVWDASLGVRTDATDPNLLKTRWKYDAFGRLRGEERPDDTATDYDLTWCNTPACQGVDSNLRTSIKQVARDTSNNEITSTSSYLDAFDRETWTVSRILSGADSTVRTIYDARGLVSQVSTPYLPGDTVWYTTTQYDLLGRPTLIRRRKHEGDASNHDTTFAYQGLRTTVTNARGQTTRHIYNAIGEIAQVLDVAGTDYEYDAFGNLLKTRDSAGTQTVLTYNNLGMKLTHSDPDMGALLFSYYPLGELRTQTDAKNQTTTFTYDALSRVVTRVEAEGTTTFGYDTGTKGIGKLTSASSPDGYSESYIFDTYGRPSQTNITADSITYSYNYGYQATTGLPETLTYPTSSSGFRLKLRYSYQNGLLSAINNYVGDVMGPAYWQAQGMNARGQIILEGYGSGHSTSSDYDPITGWLNYKTTGPSGGTTIQNLSYQWDENGNLTQRQDSRTSVTETFVYDSLDRLTSSERNGVSVLTVGYNAIGNITSKTGVGTYNYHATKKHAVASTTGTLNNTYGYDANGNMITRNGQTTTWYSYNMPKVINGAGNSSQFWYGPHRARWKQVKTNSSGTGTWTYIGPYVERLVTTSVNEFRHYIFSPTGPVALYKRSSAGTSNSTTYLTTDHLGSTDVLTTSAGLQQVNLSFNAFGERKGADGISAPTAADQTAYKNATLHGFTFHEQLDDLSLIHMNGRVYDPSIGRFMSADPYVQAPYFSQSLNRYSYVFNNPLSYTDPSGFITAADGSPADESPGTRPRGPRVPEITRAWGGYWDYTERSDPLGEIRAMGGVNFVSCSRPCWTLRPPVATIPRTIPQPGPSEPRRLVMPSNPVPMMLADGMSTVGGSQLTLNDYASLVSSGYYERTGVDIGQGMTLMVPARLYASSDAAAAAGLASAQQALGYVAAGMMLIVPGPEDVAIAGALAARPFEIAARVLSQLNDARLGALAGRLTVGDLERLANNPGARRVFDARSGNINVIQEIEGRLIRITVPRDAHRIISVGPIRPNQVENLIRSGDFVPLP